MSEYIHTEIEIRNWKLYSRRNGKHYLRLELQSDIVSSFESDLAANEWLKTLVEEELIDINETRYSKIETGMMSKSELLATTKALLKAIEAKNQKIRSENAYREHERTDLLADLSAMIDDPAPGAEE